MGRCTCTNSISALFTALIAVVVVGCDHGIDVTVAPTQIKVLEEDQGYGPRIKEGDLITIKYRITLPEGKELIKADEFKFFVDSKHPTVIQGLNDSVLGMREGGSRTIECPPHLHWGRLGTGDGAVPANTNILIDIKILKLNKQ